MSLCSYLCLTSKAVHQINLGKAKKLLILIPKDFFEQQNMHAQLPTPLHVHVYNCTDLLILYVLTSPNTSPSLKTARTSGQFWGSPAMTYTHIT